MSQDIENSSETRRIGHPTYRYTVPLPPGSQSSQTPLVRQQTEPSAPSPSHSSGTRGDLRQYAATQGSNSPTSSSTALFEEDDQEPDLPPTFVDDPELDQRNTPDKAPWKYAGYRVFSRFMASDDAFLIVRRFGNLNARIALSLQDDIVLLEQQLDDLEKGLTRRTVSRDIDNSSFRKDVFEERRKIIKEELPRKLMEYSNYTPTSGSVRRG